MHRIPPIVRSTLQSALFLSRYNAATRCAERPSARWPRPAFGVTLHRNKSGSSGECVLMSACAPVRRKEEPCGPLAKIGLAVAALGLLASPRLALAGDAAHPTVIELFQSQGCSSCPPAEANVGAVSDRADVLALSFEVDYWDRLGWKDTFSKPAWTARQYAYARAMGQDGVYTPQVVVNGRVEGDALEPGTSSRPDEPRRSRRGRPERWLLGRGGDGRDGAPRPPAAPTFGSRAISRTRSRSRSRAARTPATLCPISTWCAKWSSWANGEAKRRPSPCRRERSGLAEAVLVQANGAGPILAAAKR